MANENLKNALHAAGLTPEEFADIIHVDPKSVQRWVAGDTRPYPRNRASVARALDRTEHELWPDDIPETPIADGDDPVEPAGRLEVVAAWGRADDPGAATSATFLAGAFTGIDVLEGGGLLQSPGLLDKLRDHAVAGCEVRLLINKPTPEVVALHGHAGVQVRVIDSSFAHSVLRADDTMLLGLNLASEGTAPMLQLIRQTDDGLFDRLAKHFTRFWDHAQPVQDPDRPASQHPVDADETGIDGTAATEAPGPAERSSPRRWPGRAD
jgi:transcriptional regulator with XRE-family HTH domain